MIIRPGRGKMARPNGLIENGVCIERWYKGFWIKNAFKGHSTRTATINHIRSDGGDWLALNSRSWGLIALESEQKPSKSKN
jgi:hypothetical protein